MASATHDRVIGTAHARTGALLALSAVCLIPGELMHPEPPATPAALLRVIAETGHWPFIHFVQIVGVLLFVLGLVGASALVDHVGRLWLRTVVIIGGAILIAALTLDGDGFKGIADSLATMPAVDQGTVVAAFGPLLIAQGAMLDIATFLLFGLGTALAGMALTRTSYARAAARTGTILGAIIAIVAALGFAHAPLPPLPWYPLIVLVSSVWALWMGIALWRQTSADASVETAAVTA
jgi:hypothetical protein